MPRRDRYHRLAGKRYVEIGIHPVVAGTFGICIQRHRQTAYGELRARLFVPTIRLVLPVRNTRRIGKRDMALNDARPDIAIDPERYTVTIDGERIVPRPAATLPLAQRYFLF